MGIKEQRLARASALVLAALAASLWGCNAVRKQGSATPVEAERVDASPAAQALVAEALRQQQAGNIEAAIDGYKDALATADPHDPAKKATLLLLMALDYLQLRRWQEAAQAAAEATAIRPDYAEAYHALGFAYGNAGRSQEGIEAFQQAIRIRPDWAGGHEGLGELYSSQGRFADAIAQFERATQLDPTVSQTYFFLGIAYERVGRYRDAVVAYEHASGLKPDYVEAWFALGVAHLAIGEAQQAVESFRQTIRLKPDSAEAHNALALALAGLGSWKESLDECQRAIRIKPDLAEAFVNLSIAYSKLGRINESLEAGAEAYRLKPELAKSLAAEFHAADAPDDPNDAVVFYNQQRQAARERGDRDAEAAATRSIAEAYDALGQLADARTHLSEAIRLYRAAGNDQGEARTLTQIGRIDEDAGRYDNALASFHRAAVLCLTDRDKKGLSESLARIGHVYDAVGDPASATSWYQFALAAGKAAGDAEGEVRALLGLIELAAMARNPRLTDSYRPDFERAFPAFLAKLSPGSSAQEEPDMQRLRGPILSEVKQLSSRHAASMQEYLTRGFSESLRILSLTRRPDTPLMWAHYANGHQGFLIEFDERHQWFHQGYEGFVELGHLREVRYLERRPYASMDELNERDLLLTKSVEWKYEEEMRLVMPLHRCTQRLPGSPFDICLFALPPACVAGITLGCRASRATEDRIRRFLSTDGRYCHPTPCRSRRLNLQAKRRRCLSTESPDLAARSGSATRCPARSTAPANRRWRPSTPQLRRPRSGPEPGETEDFGTDGDELSIFVRQLQGTRAAPTVLRDE